MSKRKFNKSIFSGMQSALALLAPIAQVILVVYFVTSVEDEKWMFALIPIIFLESYRNEIRLRRIVEEVKGERCK